MSCGIYGIKCFPNGKMYIGASKIIGRRWIIHRYDLRHGKSKNKELQKDWILFGESQFGFFILEEVRSKQELLDREFFWINKTVLKYNVAYRGQKLSEETRSKISSSNKSLNRKRPDLVARNKARVGQTASKETKVKLSALKKGISLSGAHRAAISAGNKGLKRSDAAKENIKIAQQLRRKKEEEF